MQRLRVHQSAALLTVYPVFLVAAIFAVIIQKGAVAQAMPQVVIVAQIHMEGVAFVRRTQRELGYCSVLTKYKKDWKGLKIPLPLSC